MHIHLLIRLDFQRRQVLNVWQSCVMLCIVNYILTRWLYSESPFICNEMLQNNIDVDATSVLDFSSRRL